MVPNLLNLPLSVWGFATPPAIVGLGMYVSSRAAECAYCSAHTCSFALRRGASQERLARAMADDDVDRTPAERAVVAIARSLSRVPSTTTDAERAALREHFGAADVEWIVLGVAMMGWLNKFMDAVGVELEPEAIGDAAGVIGPSGWSPGKHATGAVIAASSPPAKDTLRTKLGLVPRIPAALTLDRRWTKGVPASGPAVRRFLAATAGHDFPVLERLSHGRARRAIATMVRDNLDPSTTRVGLEAKALAGVVYASVVGDAGVEADVRRLGEHHGIAAERLDAVARFAIEGGDPPGADARLAAILRLAHAASSSPATIDAAIVEECRSLEPAAVIETIVWLSVLQLLHRITAFYA